MPGVGIEGILTDLDEVLRQRVDLDETGVHSSCETTKLGHETDVALGDRLVWVLFIKTISISPNILIHLDPSNPIWVAYRAHYAAGNSTQRSDTRAQRVDHRPVPAMLSSILSIGLDHLGVRKLQVLAPGRLDLDERTFRARV